MKNFIRISLIAVLFISINSAGLYAGEGDFSFRLKRVNEKSVTFVLNGAEPVEVSISSANNEVLYEKRINAKKGAAQTYDLNSLPDGNYNFRLTTDLKIVEYKIELKDGKASVSEPSVVDMVLTKKNGVVTLNFVNAPEGAVEIQILDQNNDQLYNKVFESGIALGKRFNVAKVDKKELTFVVKSANQTFTKTVQMY